MGKGSGAGGGQKNSGGVGGRSADGSKAAKAAALIAGAALIGGVALALSDVDAAQSLLGKLLGAASPAYQEFEKMAKEAKSADFMDAGKTQFAQMLGAEHFGGDVALQIKRVGHLFEVTMAANDDSMEMVRTFNPLTKSVKHDVLKIMGEKQNAGLGSKVIRKQMESYQKLGIKHVSLEPKWKGRYVWPSMGFRPSPKQEAKLVSEFKRWGKEQGHAVGSSVKTAPDIARFSVGSKKLGKEFLLSQKGKATYSATPDTVLESLKRKGR